MSGVRGTRPRFVRPVGPRLKKLLWIVFGLVAIIGVNSVYLAAVSLAEWVAVVRGHALIYQNYFYQWMFLLHLVLGIALLLPLVLFGIFHIRNAWNRPNRRAVVVGYILFGTSLVVLLTGFILMRVDVFGFEFNVTDSTTRGIAYWLHVLAPLVCVWLYVLHRLAGRRIRWRVGVAWAVVAGVFAVAMVGLHAHDPTKWNVAGPESGEQYFFPSLARTADGNFIPARTMMMDEYCRECHPDIHKGWSHSAHRFSSFNNPAYLFSVLNTRAAMFERDGTVQGSRFCAGCHDPVPFFSGAFDDPKFDDPEYDLALDATAQAGITCTVCHAVSHINSTKGNADFTIEEPVHYPFAFSDSPFLQWVNRQLVKAKPAFHKKTFLKPLHGEAEFCATCHKVHLPPELNAYKWLRGQNHYDSYLLSGVSGHGITSWYYPMKAQHDCNGCHMPLRASTDFGARHFDASGRLTIHDHMFPSANTAIPHLLGLPEEVIQAHREFNEGVMRLDIFGVREGGEIDGELIGPIRPEIPALERGGSYLLETVIRTVKMGHLFTQGTADSNEVWLDVTVRDGDRIIGRIGGMRGEDNQVDPWSHFVNAFVIDRDGYRIDRRNAEDIFVPLYNNQIPPGAADVVHLLLDVPEDCGPTLTVDVALRFRKFDTTYMRLFQGDAFVTNDLPIMTLAEDRVTFPIAGSSEAETGPGASAACEIPEWERWHDYGIGLFRKGDSGSNRGQLRQAEHAFAEVERLGLPAGSLALARVYIKEGRLAEAVDALQRAADHDPPAPAWSIAWFTGLVNQQNGNLDEAIESYRAILAMKDTEEAREREFDFTMDYRLLNQLGRAVYDRSKQERGDANRDRREALIREAIGLFGSTLLIDAENAEAHYNLGLLYSALGEEESARHHLAQHARYRPDDNARDNAIRAARARYPAADHAADAIVIYDLHRSGAYELPPPAARPSVAGEAAMPADGQGGTGD